MPKGMGKLKELQTLTCYIVGNHEENGAGDLGELVNLGGSFRIEKIENVVNSNEAWKARMVDKKYISSLCLKWSAGEDSEMVDSQMEKDVLAKLEPHKDLKELTITGYREMPKGMGKLKDLQILRYYIVGKHEENGVGELGELVNLGGSFRIEKLENVVNSREAWRARMVDKKYMSELCLEWSSGEDSEMVDSQIEKDILAKLEPHKGLKELRMKGYRGTMFPDWLEAMASTIHRNGVVQRGTAKLDRQGANNNSILRTKPRNSHPPGPAAVRHLTLATQIIHRSRVYSGTDVEKDIEQFIVTRYCRLGTCL
ncbi:hypothetical protein AHAS_Ahas02G0230000 [Arachis hypogaea]